MPVRYATPTSRTGVTIGTIVAIAKPDSWTNNTNLTTETNNWNVTNDYPGWLPCDGRTLNVFEYRALYDVIGTTYGGTGGDSGTFNLPDYRSRKLMGTGPVSTGLSLTLTPTVGPGTSQADVNTPGSTGGIYSLTTTRQLPPDSEITPGAPSGTPVIGGAATDTFSLGNYITSGFASTTINGNATINGNVSFSAGPVGIRALSGPAPHLHAIRYVQATGGSAAEGDGDRFCTGSSGGYKNVAFFNNTSGSVNQFSREGRGLRTHSHYLYWESESSVPKAAYGHDDGAGSSGMVNPIQGGGSIAFTTTYGDTNNRGTTINKTLSMTDMAVTINDSNITLRDVTRTDWDTNLDIRLEAAEEIALMSNYFRAKYIIKAF